MHWQSASKSHAETRNIKGMSRCALSTLFVLISLLIAAQVAPAGADGASLVHKVSWGSWGDRHGQFKGPTDVAIYNDSWVYVADSVNDRIVIYNNEGSWLGSWSQTRDNGELNSPVSVAVGESGVFVANTFSNRIESFNFGGAHIHSWGGSGRNNGQLLAPMGITTDPFRKVYVSDTLNHRVQKFDERGWFDLSWGRRGDRKGEFAVPSGITTDSQGNVYVADTGNDRVQIFNGEGEYQSTLSWWWGQVGNIDRFEGPMGVAVDGQGNIFVSDSGNSRVLKFSRERALVQEIGGPGNDAGQFDRPMGLELDSAGNLYVADTGNNRIQKFGEEEPRDDADPGNGGNGDGSATSPTYVPSIIPSQGGGDVQDKTELKLDIYLVKLTPNSGAVFELDCYGMEQCRGSLSLSSKKTNRKKKRSTRKRSRVAKITRAKKSKSCKKKSSKRKRRSCRNITLGKSKFSIASGKSVKIKVRLSNKKRSWLRRYASTHRKLRLTATASMRSPKSGTVKVKRNFTLKKSRKKKR